MSAGDELAAKLAPHVSDARVLAAIRSVPRDRFVARGDPWANEALPIAEGQTISQPLVVARMCELLALSGHERVLDVGTGSGYHAAVLAQLARWVFSVEVREKLSEKAGAALGAAGVGNVSLAVGDGLAGWPAQAPFDAVNVAAAGPVEALGVLCGQLASGGRLVAPVEEGSAQRLVVLQRDPGGEVVRSDFEQVRFLPLVRS